MIQINPREIAARALLEILQEGGYNNAVLRRLLRQNGAMPAKDRAFVTETVNGTLRHLMYIDDVLNRVSTVKTEKMKPWVLAVLRSAVYQLFFMDVPENALCDEAVKLVKGKQMGTLAGFTNGVLRSIIRQKAELSLPQEPEHTVEDLARYYSHPQWLLQMWLHEHDYDFVKELCQKNNEPPDVTIVVNPLRTTPEALQKALEEKGVVVTKGRYSSQVFHLSKTADLRKWEAFDKGEFHVQDESSVLAVGVLDPQPRERVLDVCAAPGGKSFLIAEKMENQGQLYAWDIHEHKVELLQEGAERLGISILMAKEQDATKEVPELIEKFDRVLVDAPCSGLGLIRKKPDIRLRKNGNDIDTLQEIQREILTQAAKYVKKGGVLVYSTCTLCKKENTKMIEWFLREHKDYQAEDLTPYLPKTIEQTGEGYLTLYPHIHHTDGFFIARLQRKE